jgi:hypothetical protein
VSRKASSEAADVARQRPDHKQEGGHSYDRASGESREPEGEAPPVECDEDPDSAQHDEGDHEGARRGQRHLLTQQLEARDQPAHEAAERVLLALEREHAQGQQDGDEHERDGHRHHGRARGGLHGLDGRRSPCA